LLPWHTFYANFLPNVVEKKAVSLAGRFYERQSVIMADHQFSSFSASPDTSPITETSFGTGTSELPEALQPPERRVGTPFMLTIALAQTAIYLSFIPILQIILPLQVEGLDSANKVTLLGAITAVDALLALIANPLAGALSDRTTSRFGRRRPWLLALPAASPTN
jgi:hypothetical protein